jgi:hypothetical protein
MNLHDHLVAVLDAHSVGYRHLYPYRFPDGKCVVSCLAIAAVLDIHLDMIADDELAEEWPFHIAHVRGSFDALGNVHNWLQVNQYIVDPTAGQFFGGCDWRIFTEDDSHHALYLPESVLSSSMGEPSPYIRWPTQRPMP